MRGDNERKRGKETESMDDVAQELLSSHVVNMEVDRRGRVENGGQLTLGILIEKVKKIIRESEYPVASLEVYYDFCGLRPTFIDSWRGVYSELALNWEKDDPPLNITQFLSMLEKAVGVVFEGYKGGSYTMTLDTPVWVSNYGDSWSTGVIDVVVSDYNIVYLKTSYIDC